MLVKIQGISKKMKSKIKEHGDTWILVKREGDRAIIQTLKPVHNGNSYPYSVWCEIGKEILIL